MRRALSWAVLAHSPHNRQPWLVALPDGDEATLCGDLDRRLPQTDPYDRQTLIGLGCFVELMAMAAAEEGLRADVALFPEGAPDPAARLDGRPVARIVLKSDPSAARDPLFAALPLRRSVKAPFDPVRLPDESLLRAMAAVARGGAVGWTVDPSMAATLGAIAGRAWTVEATSPRVHQESVALLRVGSAEIETNTTGRCDCGAGSVHCAADHSSRSCAAGAGLARAGGGAQAARRDARRDRTERPGRRLINQCVVEKLAIDGMRDRAAQSAGRSPEPIRRQGERQ